MKFVQAKKEYNQVVYLSVEKNIVYVCRENIAWRNCLSFSSLYVSDVFYKYITQIFPILDLLIETSQYIDAIIFGETGT